MDMMATLSNFGLPTRLASSFRKVRIHRRRFRWIYADASLPPGRTTTFQLVDRSAATLLGTFAYVPRHRLESSNQLAPIWNAVEEIREPQTVLRLLRRYPFLGSLIAESRGPIQRFFGVNPQLVLDASIPDEGQEESDELLLKIQTSLPADVARAQLEALDREWWLKELPRAKHRLTLALEYV